MNEGLMVYPNPTDNIITIKQISQLPIHEVALYDCVGKLVMSEIYMEQGEVKLNLSEQTKGIYILKVKTKDNYIYRKININ